MNRDTLLTTAIFLNKSGIKPDTHRLKNLLNRGLNNEMILAILESNETQDFNDFEQYANAMIDINDAGDFASIIATR